MNAQSYEERLNVSSGYFGGPALEHFIFTSKVKRKYELAHYYLCMSIGNIWQEVRFTTKPTGKQIRKTVKQFKLYAANLNTQFHSYCDADESGELI